MTTTHSDPTRGSTRASVPPRPAAAAVAAVGPLALGGALLALPYAATEAPPGIAAAAVAAPGAMAAVVVLDLLAGLTLVAGAMIVARVAVRADAVWGTLGAVLTVAGFAAAGFAVTPPDLVAEAGARAGTDPGTTAGLLTAMAEHPASVLALVLFLAGHVLGLVCLGVAFLRGRTVPRWAATALIVSAPLHLVFTAIVAVPVLAALSWALTAAGLARAAT